MGQGSSRRDEPKRSELTPRGSARLVIPNRSVIIPAGSTRREIYSRGGQVLFAPVLQTGPTNTPAAASCLVEWTTDIDAYHRVRYKKSGGDWTTTGWSSSASPNASVNLSPLDGENVRYYYDVQSCLVGDGSQAFDWYPGDDSEDFYTLCSGVYGMANWYAQKIVEGKLSWLRLSWTTTVDMNWAEIDSYTSEPGDASWSSGDNSHMKNFYDFDFSKQGTYYWKTRNRNKCLVWCDYSAWKFFVIGSSGDIEYQS